MFASTSILCAVDLSDGTAKVIDAASELAEKLGARLTLLHVFDHPLYNMPTGFSPPVGYAEALLDADKKVKGDLERLLGEHQKTLAGRGLTVATKLVEGPAAQSIVDEAESGGHAMLVLGTHGYSGFKRFLLGSVAERVVRTAGLPVLTIQTGQDSD